MPVAHGFMEWVYIALSAGAIAVGWTVFSVLTARVFGLFGGGK